MRNDVELDEHYKSYTSFNDIWAHCSICGELAARAIDRGCKAIESWPLEPPTVMPLDAFAVGPEDRLMVPMSVAKKAVEIARSERTITIGGTAEIRERVAAGGAYLRDCALEKRTAGSDAYYTKLAAEKPAVVVTEGNKFDSGKLRWSLLPVDAVTEVIKVLMFGASKYGDRNWELGINYDRLYDSTKRHLEAWWAGEDADPETGLSHLAHCACGVLFLLAFRLRGKDAAHDNRPKGSDK